jgi:hypothetical protein
VLALVLGTLVSSRFSAFSTQEPELERPLRQTQSNSTWLWRNMSRGQGCREILRNALVHTHELFWGKGGANDMGFGVSVALPGIRAMNDSLNAPDPKTLMQKALFSSAVSYDKAIGARRG